MKNKWIVFTGLGFEIIGILLISIFVGEYFDNYLKLKGFLTITFCFLGLGGWFAHILNLIKKVDKK